MTWSQQPRNFEPPRPEQAFEVWFGQSLRTLFEPVVHEDLPPQIVDALPPPAPER